MKALTNKSGGMCLGFPDVCKTPTPGGPVPIPYPNIVQTEAAKPYAKKVKFEGMKALTQKSKWKRSMGDEAGTGGGIISSKNMGPTGFIMGSLLVKIEGAPAVYQFSPTKHNGDTPNTVGAALQAPQTKVDITM
ncbi:MAG TPA: DUF4150 domain-containing protein [archaeon]|nr:DUF4150 domain-containing protein [archaeon]